MIVMQWWTEQFAQTEGFMNSDKMRRMSCLKINTFLKQPKQSKAPADHLQYIQRQKSNKATNAEKAFD